MFEGWQREDRAFPCLEQVQFPIPITGQRLGAHPATASSEPQWLLASGKQLFPHGKLQVLFFPHEQEETELLHLQSLCCWCPLPGLRDAQPGGWQSSRGALATLGAAASSPFPKPLHLSCFPATKVQNHPVRRHLRPSHAAQPIHSLPVGLSKDTSTGSEHTRGVSCHNSFGFNSLKYYHIVILFILLLSY